MLWCLANIEAVIDFRLTEWVVFDLPNPYLQLCKSRMANINLPLQALRQSTGAQRQHYESWRSIMLRCLANIEAVIDFGEDEEIAEEVAQQVLPKMQALQQQLQHHLVNGEQNNIFYSRSKFCKQGCRVTSSRGATSPLFAQT